MAVPVRLALMGMALLVAFTLAFGVGRLTGPADARPERDPAPVGPGTAEHGDGHDPAAEGG